MTGDPCGVDDPVNLAKPLGCLGQDVSHVIFIGNIGAEHKHVRTQVL